MNITAFDDKELLMQALRLLAGEVCKGMPCWACPAKKGCRSVTRCVEHLSEWAISEAKGERC